MNEWVSVFAPATVANVGPGFDIMGFAINEPGDIVAARLIPDDGIRIVEICYADPRDAGKLPTDPKSNTAGIAAECVLSLLRRRKLIDRHTGIELILQKNLPLGSGMGSSGASAVAAAWAVNLLFGTPLHKHDPELILACAEAEARGSGFHADNVAPAMLGGFVLIRSYNPLEVIPLEAPENMVCVVVTPDFNLPTRRARAAIPQQVSFQEVVVPQCANIAGLIAGLWAQDLSLIGRSVEDKIVEPARTHLIPGFMAVKQAALEQGAFGCSISGAGPSVFAITDNLESGQRIGQTMSDVFAQYGLQHSAIHVSHVNREGARAIE